MAEAEAAEAVPALPAPSPSRLKGFAKTAGTMLLLTVLALGAGGGLGLHLTATVEETLKAKAKEAAAASPLRPEPKYSGDMAVQNLEPIITNLAVPEDTWIRLETAIVFDQDTLDNPAATAAEIQQDILAYARTITLDQLQGPSALQHLREDLNERVSVRTSGQVSELVIKTMIVQ